jgi:hypothetical protein
LDISIQQMGKAINGFLCISKISLRLIQGYMSLKIVLDQHSVI